MTPARAVAHRLAPPRTARALALGAVAVAATIAAQPTAPASAAPLTGVDLSTYVRVGRYDLPEPTRTTAPARNLLAQEASGVTYDWDTGTLFVVGDGGTSVTEVSTTGQLVSTMTLPAGASAQGTEFFDTEGIAYIGNGQFVFTEERDRQLVRFTYVASGTLQRSAAKTVKLGTTIGNVGFEGVSNDPTTGGFLVAKEIDPSSLFSTTIDWDAGTASNGSPTATASTDLFDPALPGLADFSDVYALSNVPALAGTPDASHLLMISQESGKIVDVDRSGHVSSSLTLVQDAGNPLTIQDQTHEGVTMGPDGTIYEVSEQGGGDADHPQLWVFQPSATPNAAPTAVTLGNAVTSIAENASTTTRIKVADVSVTDDGLGTNALALTGADASSFELSGSELYLKAGTTLNRTTKPSYSVSVTADDATVGATPDVTSAAFTLTVGLPISTVSTVRITEVSPWSSSGTGYGSDWFELTNTGSTAVDLTGWRMDDSSAAFATAVPLLGVSSLAPGQSAVFVESDSDSRVDYRSAWFGAAAPAGVAIGHYSGSGVGLSSSGDGVAVFDGAQRLVTGVKFGASASPATFDNAAGIGGPDMPAISALSVVDTNGAFLAADGVEVGSPGAVASPRSPLQITEIDPTGSGTTTYKQDWFELTNTGTAAIDLTGWKMDDSSAAFASAVPLAGVSSLGAGQTAIFLEDPTGTAIAAFKATWFPSGVPGGLLFGTYTGSGVGLSSNGDAVNLYDAAGKRVIGVAFGAATDNVSFDNAAGVGSSRGDASPVIATLSVAGTNGAFSNGAEIGSPGAIANPVVGTPASSGGGSSTSGASTTPSTPGSGASSTPTTTAPTPLPPAQHPPIPAEPKKAKAALTDSASPKALEQGITGTLSGLEAKTKVKATIVSRGHSLRAFTVTVNAKGVARVTLKLTGRQLAKLHGKTLTVRFAVVGADGKRHTLTTKVKVKEGSGRLSR